MGKKATQASAPGTDSTERVISESQQIVPDGVSATGRVDRLYPDRRGCFIRLNTSSPRPLDGLYQLELAHPNYNAMYSLALAAAVNGLSLTIRTQAIIKPTERALVEYLKQDF